MSESIPLNTSAACTVPDIAKLGAVMPTVMVIDCGAVKGVPPLRLPPRFAMVQTMLFTDTPFNTPGAGAEHVGVPSAG